jgi:1-deoxy-D-xylulose-5-phosphate reductoisomerase
MGEKITVDCASMMNKGLEVIEAHYLFGMPSDKLDVLVHPQSLVHSMVEFEDGAVLAQLGVPDMRAAIGYAMGYPRRLPFGGERVDLARIGTLSFSAPDPTRFPCLGLAREALVAGEAHMVALNGANEAAVEAFLEGRIPFGGIHRTVRAVLDRTVQGRLDTPEAVYEADRIARQRAWSAMKA